MTEPETNASPAPPIADSKDELVTEETKQEEEIEEGMEEENVVQQFQESITAHDTLAIQTVVEKIQSLSTDQQITFIQEEEVYDAVAFHWRWNDAGSRDDPVCNWLCSWFQIDSSFFKNFVLQFVPEILWNFMIKRAHNVPCPGIKALLLCIANDTAFDLDQKERIFNIPNIQCNSVLHTAPTSKNLEESDSFQIIQNFQNIITKDEETKEMKLVKTISVDKLLQESVHRLSKNFANVCAKAKIAFIAFLKSFVAVGLPFLIPKKGLGDINVFFTKESSDTEPQKVEQSTVRFNPKTKRTVSGFVLTYADVVFPVQEQFMDQCLKILGFCLYSKLPGALETAQIVQKRAQIDLLPRTLMEANALLNKFDKKY